MNDENNNTYIPFRSNNPWKESLVLLRSQLKFKSKERTKHDIPDHWCNPSELHWLWKEHVMMIDSPESLIITFDRINTQNVILVSFRIGVSPLPFPSPPLPSPPLPSPPLPSPPLPSPPLPSPPPPLPSPPLPSPPLLSPPLPSLFPPLPFPPLPSPPLPSSPLFSPTLRSPTLSSTTPSYLHSLPFHPLPVIKVFVASFIWILFSMFRIVSINPGFLKNRIRATKYRYQAENPPKTQHLSKYTLDTSKFRCIFGSIDEV